MVVCESFAKVDDLDGISYGVFGNIESLWPYQVSRHIRFEAIAISAGDTSSPGALHVLRDEFL